MSSKVISWRASMPVEESLIPGFDELLTAVGASIVIDKLEKTWVITSFFEAEMFTEDAVESVLNNAFEVMQARPTVLDIAPVFEEDILAKMKRDFPPLEVASFFIHTFDEEVPEGMTEIKVPAGIAFGTGEHPTTAGCLTLYDDIADSRTFKNGLDMGCGSAILSMASAKRDAVPFLAVDIDAPSVGIAKQNCEANGVTSKISCICGDGFQAKGVQEGKGYDLVFANILANPLIKMSADLIDVMADDGVAILSGFLVDQRDDVLAAYEAKGLTLLEDITLGEWVAAALVKAS